MNCGKIHNTILWCAGYKYSIPYRWTDGKLSPEKGKLLILMRRGSHDEEEARRLRERVLKEDIHNLFAELLLKLKP